MQTGTKFIHLRRIKTSTKEIRPHGGKTIAYREILNADNTKTIFMGLAQCSRNDLFNRKIGRAVAQGRLDTVRNGTEHIRMVVSQDTDSDQTIRAVFGRKDLC